jgi:molybdopterin/thiamine biosynthesis adenylyltransferase
MSGFPAPSSVTAAPACLIASKLVFADAFYAERDQRTGLGGALASHMVRVAIVLAPGLEQTVGGQTALIWTASMLRRMGRCFSNSLLVADSAAPTARYVGALRRGAPTLGEAVAAELGEADPFGSIEWRPVGDPRALADAGLVIWLGGEAASGETPPLGEVWVGSSGWVISSAWIPPAAWGGHMESTRRHAGAAGFEASAAAAIAAAASAVAHVYRVVRDVRPREGESLSLCYSVDTGQVSTSADECAVWLKRGTSAESCAPWTAERGEAVGLGDLTLVSAGGIGGNAAQVLSGSHAGWNALTVIEPDLVDISNLNRLVGAGVSDVGQPKLGPALRALGGNATTVQAPYEAWIDSSRPAGLAEPSHHVLVGVDQAATRLQAQADWPYLLVNAGTSGTSWTISAHRRGRGACIGCLYAASEQAYAASRRALACGAGMPSVGEERITRPEASYPFASVMAAATQVAVLIRTVWEESPGVEEGCSVRVLNSLTMSFATVAGRSRHPDCPLLCGHPALVELWGEAAVKHSAGAVGESE